MFSSLKELSGVSKEEFLDYYYKCLMLDMPVSDKLKFSVSEFDETIGVDISGLRESVVVIPTFVDYIYKDYTLSNINTSIQTLDLSNVHTITRYGLCDFRGLDTIKGEKLVEISDNAFDGCCRLRTVDCKNIKSIGYHCFSKCSVLKELEFPELMYTKYGWCFFSGLKKLYAPKLRKLETLRFTGKREIQLELGSDTVIQHQENNVSFILNNQHINWFGEPIMSSVSSYSIHDDMLRYDERYGYYTTWGDVIKYNELCNNVGR